MLRAYFSILDVAPSCMESAYVTCKGCERSTIEYYEALCSCVLHFEPSEDLLPLRINCDGTVETLQMQLLTE